MARCVQCRSTSRKHHPTNQQNTPISNPPPFPAHGITLSSANTRTLARKSPRNPRRMAPL
ncbi:hypothetical protein EMPG_14283 [Blastomyces silverae]|uniref:Uncharacterized protein n=1 Tax=Blastomyces silverae TaxID=2060906 RepID=A0A0H1BFX2_9EURO|nr:hypothetical protein EMPG_14283 [Blastomyces silverae]